MNRLPVSITSNDRPSFASEAVRASRPPSWRQAPRMGDMSRLSAPAARDAKTTPPAGRSEPLAGREAQQLESAEHDRARIREAVRTIDEAYSHLKRHVEARGGQAHFAQPYGGPTLPPMRGGDAIDPDAPDMLARLKLLRKEVHAALRLSEPGGMYGAKEREDVLARLDSQGKRLDDAFRRWTIGLAARAKQFDPQGVSLRTDLPGASPDLTWQQVRMACVDLAHPTWGLLRPALSERAEQIRDSFEHHPFYLPRLLETKALYWQAAAETLKSLLPPPPLATRRVTVLPAAPLDDDGLDHKHSTSGRGHRPRPAERPTTALEAGGTELDPVRTAYNHFESRHDALIRQSKAPSSQGRLAEPSEILGVGSKPSSGAGFPAGLDAEVRDESVRHTVQSGDFPDRGPMWEREFALACVKRVVADSRRATAPGLAPASGPLAGIRRWWSRRHAGKADGVQAFANVTDKDIEKTFGRIYSEMLSRRANPVVRSRVVVPVLAVAPQPSSAGGDRLAGASPKPRRQVTVPRVLHFEQRPAIAVSDALAASLAADGVQGAHCHERTQHKHAVNLFVSRMDDDRGHRMLTITRHGVLAANQLERKGIRSLRDEDLYRIAVDLADTLASTPIRDTRLRDALKNNEFDDLQSKDHAGQPSKAKVAAIAALIRGQRPRTKTSAIAESEGLRSASVIEDDRRVADGRAPAMPTLIDNIRRAASLNRAREAAAAAFASLPDDEIRRLIHATAVPESKYDDPDPTRRVPATLRLCSVSLMTPDWFRATFYSYEDDERTMWQDQARAWADLESLGGLALPMPRVDAEGLPLRDSNGCLLTVAPSGPDGGPAPTLPIRFQVAALNTPVNAWGTRGRRAGAISGAHAAADDINRHAITRLIGNTPEAWASCPPGQIPKGTGGSWLSNHLRSTTVSDKEKRILRTLAAQIGALYASKAHLSAGNDPYKLATRLIVLANRLGGTAAASPIATLVNCKSGKDRTSVAETEARQMALEIDVTGEVPPVGAEVTELLTRQLGAIHESGGSRPLQAWNTGMAGTKLEGEALYRRFGLFTKDRIRSFLGLSKFTKG